MKLRQILHITPWYPTTQNQHAGIFIKRHILALAPHFDNQVLHIHFEDCSIRGIPRVLFHQAKVQDGDAPHVDVMTLINFPGSWWLREWACFILVCWYLIKNRGRFELVNFCIAYPTAVQIQRLKRLFSRLKFSITEHWSAYHLGFSLPPNSPGRKRIQRIFQCDTPLFVVSNALGTDIQCFCGQAIPYKVIPNIVDTQRFQWRPAFLPENGSVHIASINSWSSMKNPFVLIEAFALVSKRNPSVKLTLGGGGPLLDKMRALVQDLEIANRVTFTGVLDAEQVAQLLNNVHIYCQSSNYETFSVICAEALSSGVPVIATNAGGMKDFINDSNGLLVNEMTPQSWAIALEKMILQWPTYDLSKIAKSAQNQFNAQSVGHLFQENISALL